MCNKNRILEEKLLRVKELCNLLVKDIDSGKDMYYYYNQSNLNDLIIELNEINVISCLLLESGNLKVNLNEVEKECEVIE